MGIVAILGGVGLINFFGARNVQVLENQVNKVVADLRWTMTRSIAQESSDKWAIRFRNPTGASNDYYEIWRSSDGYTATTVVSTIYLDGGLSFSDPTSGTVKDVIFSKATGLPGGDATITIDSTLGGGSGTINVNSQGRVDYSTQ